MAGFLFEQVVFGPVRSRRLGISLGLNLLPENRKVCTFNCLYCECGWTSAVKGSGLSGAEGEGERERGRERGRDRGTEGRREGLKSQRSALSAARGLACNEAGNKTMGELSGFPGRDVVRAELERKLAAMAARNDMITNITFAGNGEPTLHPDFPSIVDDVVELRNRYFPNAGISVLSNASLANNDAIINALMKADQNILKLDAGTEKSFRQINNPIIDITLAQVIENLARFHGNLIIQTLFVRGTYRGERFDNTTPEEITNWLSHLEKLKPRSVMIYPIARATPIDDVQKISPDELQTIAQRVEALGLQVEVYD